LAALIAALPTQALFGCAFVSETTMAAIVEVLLADGSARSTGWRSVVTPNVDHLVRYEHDERAADVARQASLTLPDGMPIVWASRLLRRPLARRLAGSDLFAELWPVLAQRSIPCVVVAATTEVADGLRAEHPDLRVLVPPQFSVSDDDVVERLVEDIVAQCADVGARFLFVGLSMPKHHLLASRLAERWSNPTQASPVVLLVGAATDFYLGLAVRAPQWMQRAGLEWAHRLARDPRRMVRRYLVDDLRFAGIVWREWRRLPPEPPSRRGQ